MVERNIKPGMDTALWSVFSDLAARLADKDAILAPERPALTFAALQKRIAATKHELNRLGIGRGDRVALSLPNGADATVCLLGAMACASAAPLDPASTSPEFREYLSRIRPKAIILTAAAQSPAREVATELGIAAIELDTDAPAAAGTFTLSAATLRACADPSWNSQEDIGLILLTSGSTSRQKLVPLRARHLVANALANKALLGLGLGDRSLHLMPLFHGAGVKSSLTVPLISGTAVVCLPQFEVSSFFRYLDFFRPTWFTAGYAFHHAILEAAGTYRDVIHRSRLRFIRSGTGRLDPEVMRGLERAFGVPVIEQYSSSETGTIACRPMAANQAKPGTVGRPVVNEVAILGSNGILPGTDQEGEIVVRGPSVFDGYLDDLEANNAAFIDGWYRTGDLGRMDAEGFLTITGRTKETINRGGEKISPREVELVLAGHGAIREIKVFGIPHPSLGQEVVAAVVLREGASASEAALKAFAAASLAGFKVPRRIFFRSALPLAPSRKLDFRRLVRECEALLNSERSASFAADRPASATEELIRDLWRKALGTDRVELDDDFFLLGGDSLKAVELLISVEEAFGVEVPAGAMYGTAATVAKLAAKIDRLRTGEAAEFGTGSYPVSRRRTMLRSGDLVTLATLGSLTLVAWLMPQRFWPVVCARLASMHLALRGLPSNGLGEALARLGSPMTPKEMQQAFLSCVYEDLVMTLREHLPLAWCPAIRLRGAEHIAAARASGRGAVLWSCPSANGGLISKKALKAAGVQLVNLRSAIHPYSATWFGAKLLNPIRTAVEDRYLAGTVIVHGPDGLGAFQQLRAHLAANTVVSIAANGSEGTPFELPFLGGTLKLSLGAPTLAALHRAPLLPVFTSADGGGGFEVTIGAPLAALSHDRVGETARDLARAYAKVLEAHLREHPADWRGWFMRHTWSPRATPVPRPEPLLEADDSETRWGSR